MKWLYFNRLRNPRALIEKRFDHFFLSPVVIHHWNQRFSCRIEFFCKSYPLLPLIMLARLSFSFWEFFKLKKKELRLVPWILKMVNLIKLLQGYFILNFYFNKICWFNEDNVFDFFLCWTYSYLCADLFS